MLVLETHNWGKITLACSRCTDNVINDNVKIKYGFARVCKALKELVGFRIMDHCSLSEVRSLPEYPLEEFKLNLAKDLTTSFF